MRPQSSALGELSEPRPFLSAAQQSLAQRLVLGDLRKNSKPETRNCELLAGALFKPSFGLSGILAVFAAAFLFFTTAAFAQTTAPPAITDPAKLKSQTVVDMQNFAIDKLYTTRAIGGSTWSPDGKQVAFVTNISGRNNIWIVPANGGWPTPADHQRSAADQPGLVARR